MHRAIAVALLTGAPVLAQIGTLWSVSSGLTASLPKSFAFQGQFGITGEINRALVLTPFGTVGAEIAGTYFKSGAVLVCPAATGAPCDLRQLPGFVQTAVSAERSSKQLGGLALYARATAGIWSGHDSNAFAGQSASESGFSGLGEVGAQIGRVETGLAYQRLGGARIGHIGLASIRLHVGV